MLQCLWLVVALTRACLGSGLYPVSASSSVEAHGPLAHLALQSHYALDPLNKNSLQRSSSQKHFYDVEAPPVTADVVELQQPHSLSSSLSAIPTGYHYQRPLLHHSGVYPQVSYTPLQVQYFPPAYFQQQYPTATQPLYHYPVITQPSYQYPVISHPPQQVPQPPQQVPTTNRPPQQFPAKPQLPQEPVSMETQPSVPSTVPEGSPNTEFEFDSSDTVVVENPDFTRSGGTDVRSRENCKNKKPFEREFEKEVLTEVNSLNKNHSDQERIIQNIISDFENLQLLRMFRTKEPLRSPQLPRNFQSLLEPLSEVQQSHPTFEKNLPLQRSQETTEPRDGNVSVKNLSSDRSSSPSTTEREQSILYRASLSALQTNTFPTASTESSGFRSASSEELQENRRRLLELLKGHVESESGAVKERVFPESRKPCAEKVGHVTTGGGFVVSNPVEGVDTRGSIYPLYY